MKKKKQPSGAIESTHIATVTAWQACRNTQINHLHELKGSLKVLHGIHLDPEELHAHDETDDALDHEGTLLLLPQLLQFCDEFLPHCLKPEHVHGDEKDLLKWNPSKTN